MAVDEIGPFDGAGHGEVDRHGLQGGRLRLGLRPLAPRLMSNHARLITGRSPALDGYVGEVAQLACEVLDVNSRAAVHVRRVLAGQKCDLAHAQQPSFVARSRKSVACTSAAASGSRSAPPPGPFSSGRSTKAARKPAASAARRSPLCATTIITWPASSPSAEAPPRYTSRSG